MGNVQSRHDCYSIGTHYLARVFYLFHFMIKISCRIQQGVPLFIGTGNLIFFIQDPDGDGNNVINCCAHACCSIALNRVSIPSTRVRALSAFFISCSFSSTNEPSRCLNAVFSLFNCSHTVINSSILVSSFAISVSFIVINSPHLQHQYRSADFRGQRLISRSAAKNKRRLAWFQPMVQ